MPGIQCNTCRSNCYNPAEAEAAIVAGDVRAALVFPENLTQRIANGDVVGQWLVDGSDTMVSSALLALRTMPLHLEAGAPQGAYRETPPSFEVALFFNPERRSAVNIVPALTAIKMTSMRSQMAMTSASKPRLSPSRSRQQAPAPAP